MNNLFGKKLASARKMSGMSLQELSVALDYKVTKQSLSKYEIGKMKPNSGLLIELSKVLNVPVDYFFSTSGSKIFLSEFRLWKGESRLLKSEQMAIEEKSKEIFERYFELESMFNFNDYEFNAEYKKLITEPRDAENAAKAWRKKWNLGDHPIADVVQLLEDQGFKIIEINGHQGFVGFSGIMNGKRVIVLQSEMNPIKKRFFVLKDIAFQFLKFSPDLNQREKEKLCENFAGAFLYPEERIKEELSNTRFEFYQKELEIISDKWGISFLEILNRALYLGIINEYVFKKYKERFKEPDQFFRKEQPTRFKRLILLGLAKEVITINEAAFFEGKTLGEFRNCK